MGRPMAIGIGLSSGPAQVGNTGSKLKFKYGPLGNTVNLASRIQGATKYLKTRVLITDATCRALAPTFQAAGQIAEDVSELHVTVPATSAKSRGSSSTGRSGSRCGSTTCRATSDCQASHRSRVRCM